MEKRLYDVPGSNVYIADIGLNGQLTNAGGSPYALLDRIASRAGIVHWIDHHETTLGHRELLRLMNAQLYYNSERCAALLIYDMFDLPGRYEHELAHIAQAHDHKKPGSTAGRVKVGNELEKIIALANLKLDYEMMMKLTVSLAQDTCFDSHFMLQGEWGKYSVEFDTCSVSAYRELESSIVVEEVAGLRVLFAYSPAILSMKPALEYMQVNYTENVDLYFCVFRSPARNHLILKRPNLDFPVIQVASDFGGGGRGNGGGFSTVYDVTPVEYTNLKTKIVEKIVQYSKCKG